METLNRHVKSGMAYEDAWNCTSVQLVAASEVVLAFIPELNKCNVIYLEFNKTFRNQFISILQTD